MNADRKPNELSAFIGVHRRLHLVPGLFQQRLKRHEATSRLCPYRRRRVLGCGSCRVGNVFDMWSCMVSASSSTSAHSRPTPTAPTPRQKKTKRKVRRRQPGG